MWVWFQPMTFVHMTIAIYILMCPVSANNPNVSQMEGTIQTNKPQEMDLSMLPLLRKVSSLSAKMKDFINFLDLRARGKWAESKTDESKVIVDLDQTKVDVLGGVPKEAALFTKRVKEEGIVVDVPKSSLFRQKRWNAFNMSRKIKVPAQILMFYKTSTPRFRSDHRQFRTTKIIKNIYKAFLSPLKKMFKKPKSMNKYGYNKRSYNGVKPMCFLNNAQQNFQICQASHVTNNPVGHFKKFKKIPRRPFIGSLEYRDHDSTFNPFQSYKNNSEISEAALFQIINKLIQDSKQNITMDKLEINIPSVRPFVNMTWAVEANHQRNMPSLSPPTADSKFNLAVIIAKLTEEPRQYSFPPATDPGLVSTIIQKYRSEEKNSLTSLFPKILETTSEHFFGFEKELMDNHPRNNTLTSTDSDRWKIEKIHANRLSQHQPREVYVGGLMKEIIRHVSIALEAVTTSKEFLDLISCENVYNKSIIGNTECLLVTNNPVSTASTFRVNLSSVRPSEEDRTWQQWQKTKDSCVRIEATCEETKSSTTQLNDNCYQGSSPTNGSKVVTDSSIKNTPTSGSTKLQSTTNIKCDNISTSTECSVFLDDEIEYYEPLNITGYSPILFFPEPGGMVNDYKTDSYQIERNNIVNSVKIKRNRKSNVKFGTGNPADSEVYNARELINELERYHLMLQDPVVTKLWRFFQVPTGFSATELACSSPINRLKKRKSKVNIRIGTNIKEDHDKRSEKRKVKSVTGSILYKLNKSNVSAFETSIQMNSSKVFENDDPGNQAVRTKKKKEVPIDRVSKFEKLIRESGEYHSYGRQDKNSIGRSEYIHGEARKLKRSSDSIKSEVLAVPSTTCTWFTSC
ncbi:uncharacterized protein [Halyomorpha halys]|uniref:uncharacterized protein n=1 Tax=Halyomorpha halys TaxID=286706 RepID=UPI0006D4C6E2|nr:uncharacterized protein LOC106677441 [Halyomorpha halys]